MRCRCDQRTVLVGLMVDQLLIQQHRVIKLNLQLLVFSFQIRDLGA